jgi:hypothetical protein
MVVHVIVWFVAQIVMNDPHVGVSHTEQACKE